jgi:prephenate dehydratase
MQKVGYLGPEGTFSHNAAIKLKEKRPDTELVWNGNMAKMAGMVRDGSLDAVLLPVENSTDGPVGETMDVLSSAGGLYIFEEYVYPIEANLITNEGVRQENIKEIFSHPQPIGQCRKYIDENLKNARITLTYSTTAGVIKVKEEGTPENGYAAIGTREAAKLFGLKVIASSIQDNVQNATRFIFLKTSQNMGSENTRTSLIFSTEDRPGSLFKVLEIFDLFDVNLKRIESRPSKMSLGKYIFFVDIEGDSREANNTEALKLLKMKASFYSFLGSYPEYKL